MRFRLRDGLQRLTTIGRVSACGRGRVSKEHPPTVRIQGDGAGRVAHFAGVRLCGSIHCCPVCGPRIRQRRAEDIDLAAVRWLHDHGPGTVLLLTLTLPHDYGERLADLLATVRASFSALVAGRAWQADKRAFGLAHYIAAHDATVGARGWHPHMHVLIFADRQLSPLDSAALEARLHERWARAVTRRGHRAPSREHGVRVEVARTRRELARYVAQVVAGDDLDDAATKPVALELARGDLKRSWAAGHRTPWQVLADLVTRRAARADWTAADDTADDRDLALWREWEQATRRVQAIRWSRGLRRAVGLGAEATDEAIVNEVIGGVDCYRLPDDDSWSAITQTPGARALVLAAAERAGVLGARHAVERIRARWRARETTRRARIAAGGGFRE